MRIMHIIDAPEVVGDFIVNIDCTVLPLAVTNSE